MLYAYCVLPAVGVYLLQHSSEDIRKAAINALGRMCAVWYRVLIEGNHSEDDRANLSMYIVLSCSKISSFSLFPELLVNVTMASMGAIVRTDIERSVVIATLETLESVLKVSQFGKAEHKYVTC